MGPGKGKSSTRTPLNRIAHLSPVRYVENIKSPAEKADSFSVKPESDLYVRAIAI